MRFQDLNPSDFILIVFCSTDTTKPIDSWWTDPALTPSVWYGRLKKLNPKAIVYHCPWGHYNDGSDRRQRFPLGAPFRPDLIGITTDVCDCVAVHVGMTPPRWADKPSDLDWNQGFVGAMAWFDHFRSVWVQFDSTGDPAVSGYPDRNRVLDAAWCLRDRMLVEPCGGLFVGGPTFCPSMTWATNSTYQRLAAMTPIPPQGCPCPMLLRDDLRHDDPEKYTKMVANARSGWLPVHTHWIAEQDGMTAARWAGMVGGGEVV